MTRTITNKLAVLLAALAVAFGAAFTASAAYEGLEIEIDVYDDRVEVEVEYDGDSEDYLYEDKDLDGALEELVDDLEDDFDIEITAEEIEDLADITEEDENDEESMEDAEDAIGEAEDAIEDAEEWIEEADEDDADAASTTLAEAKDLLADAEEAFGTEDYDEAMGLAEDAEELAKSIFEEEDEDESEDEDDSDFCDRTSNAAGWGVAKKCVDDEDYELNDKMVRKVERFQERSMEKYKDYGKSTDRAELQNQLRELLLVLIELLQKQMALQETNS